jgi:murein DD-endopeptidase MepM/ murein hydrolase activator NlpD
MYFAILRIMRSHTYIGIACIVGCALFVHLLPSTAEARHTDGRSSAFERKIRALDEDVVEDLHIPVLFGMNVDDVFPNFGDPRDGGSRTHEGLDFMAKLGTPIVSPTEAVVTRVGEGDSAGLYVYTANPGGESFRYMHLDSIADIDAGDVLQKGDLIGTVGDTGNAQGGAPHLHFEIRKGDALDPHPRITQEFTLKEKIGFVAEFFNQLDDEEQMAAFLVEAYRSDFTQALNAGYTLPDEIEDALQEAGVVSVSALKTQLDAVVASIPKVVQQELALGSTGASVSLLQFYLIYENAGPASQALGQAGATGYFGPVTASALLEYQRMHKADSTGVYDAQTREIMQG